MYAFAAWFYDSPVDPAEVIERQRRARAHLDEVTPGTWEEQSWSGPGWDVIVRQVPQGAWRWRFAERGAGTVAVAAGFALGADPTSPAPLGRRLLDGEEVHRNLTAPFGLVAVDETHGRMAAQQDWHGMGQVFHYERPGAMALSNRPSLLPRIFGDPAQPQVRGWSLYLATGAFADDSSPVRRVRQLAAGEHLRGRRDAGARWSFTSEQRYNLDDIIAEATHQRPALDDLADSVIDVSRRVVRGLAHYYAAPLAMGLSGGKDSRMLAASLVTDGLISRFRTNEQTPAEGETARRLNALLKQHRGLEVDHEFYVATSRARVSELTVSERARLIQRDHDFMYRSTYLNRPEHDPLPAQAPSPGILGVLGEYLSDYWLPAHWKDDPSAASHDQARDVLARRLGSTARRALNPGVWDRLDALLDHIMSAARANGLTPFQTVTYGYMVGRMRRNCTSQARPEQIMPLALPETIRASMQLTPQQKVDQALHLRVIERLMPEWVDVPFVSVTTGVRAEEVVRIWDGPGRADLSGLIDEEPGPVSRLFRRPFVDRVFQTVSDGAGGNREDGTLRQFAMAKAADRAFG